MGKKSLKKFKKLQNDNRVLAEDNKKLQSEYRKLKNMIDSAKSVSGDSNSTNNVDLLKRISNLEKIVYGKED